MRTFLILVCAILFADILAGADLTRNIRIISDRCPDFYNTKTMAAWAVKDKKTDQEKVLAIYDLYRSMAFHHMYPNEKDCHVGTLKLINVYGWTLCGGQASCLITLYQDAGYQTRYRGWSNPGHTTMEVNYGGKWHFLDSFLKFIPYKEDGTIASQEEVIKDPQIVSRLELDPKRKMYWYPEQMPDETWTREDWNQAHPMLFCGDKPDGCIKGCQNSKVVGWAGTGTRDKDNYKTDINLRPGMSLTLRWEADQDGWYTATGKVPGHSCGTREIRNCPIIGPKHEPYGKRAWSNGNHVFEPDLKQRNGYAGFDRAQPGLYVITMESPFVVSHASIEAVGKGDVKIDVKSRLGKQEGLAPGELPDAVVRGVYSYTVTIRTARLQQLKIDSLICHNRGARPFLLPGANSWTFTQDAPARKGKTIVEVAYKPRYHQKKLIDKYKSGENLYDNKHVKEDSKPVIVQFPLQKRRQTATINVPSDTTDDPAYPRMVYLKYMVQ